MTEQENQWRGPLEIEESPRSLEEIQRSWILRPAAERKTSGRFGLQKMLLVAVVVSALLTGVITATFKTVPKHKQKQQQQDDNYTIALHKALEFFNAQKSGKLPEGNNISWRGDSCLQDGKGFQFGFFKDLVGGYYEAGDAIKFSFPTSYAMTMLSWSVIEYGAQYEAMGELNRIKGLVKWGTDYILKTFDNTSETIDTIVSKVGSGNDRYCWLRPEDIKYTRDVFLCSRGCSDIAAEMAAALASASILFKDEKLYSKELVEGARKLYEFADSTRGRYSNTKAESKESLHSTSFYDELLWGGTWLYYATGDIAYLAKVTNPVLARRAGAFSNGDTYRVFSWDNKLPGAQVLLTRLRLFLSPGYPYEDILSSFHNQTGVVMCSFLLDFNKFNRTKGGLIELNSGGPKPLQYAANAAFLAALFSDYLEAADTPGWYCGPTFYHTNVLRVFAQTQIDYILGDNPQNMSYVVGFGQRYPRHVHHMGASIPKRSGIKESCTGGWKWRDSKKENPNTIVGAMVAGPDRHDGFRDVRADYNYTEPSLAGNAGLVAALAALSREGDGKPPAIDINRMFSAIPPYYPVSPPPPAPWTP